jgi:hypothetical protein
MNIMKFNEAQDLGSLLSQYKLGSSGLDDMVTKLKKYRDNLGEEGISLLEDLEREYKSKWANIRKWKLDSIMARYQKAISEMEQVDDIEDMLLELEDAGWQVEIFTKANTLRFRTGRDHQIKKLHELFSFLHNTHKFGFKLKDLIVERRDIRVEIIYRLKTVEWTEEETTDDKFKHSAQREEDEDFPIQHRVINPITFEEE